MKPFSLKPNKKTRAQAMVEFMLALPLLLVLIYGTIEVARLIFILSSVSNASRQAARYGSATGQIDNVAYYQNCDGIREVGDLVGVLLETMIFNKLTDAVRQKSCSKAALSSA